MKSPPRQEKVEDSQQRLKADVPGIAREDLHVSVDGGVLTISGERHQEKRRDRARCHRLERSSGSFLRSFSLPGDSDATAFSACCQDGQLRITVPRRAEAAARQAAAATRMRAEGKRERFMGRGADSGEPRVPDRKSVV